MTRSAIVTASDSGIGKAVAVALARDGLDVGITWHDDEAGAADTADQVRALGRRAEEGGRLVAVTSVHEHAPRVGACDYVTAKHGLGELVKNAAIELAQHGITVNGVAPGEIATPLTGQEDVDPTSVERPGVPLRRVGDAHEVAATIAFLCSDAAAYTTGASYVVDGGMLQMGPHAGSHLESDAWREG